MTNSLLTIITFVPLVGALLVAAAVGQDGSSWIEHRARNG